MKNLNNLEQTVRNLNYYIENWNANMVTNYVHELNTLGYITTNEIFYMLEDITNDGNTYSVESFI